MPIYEYFCQKCEHEFTQANVVAERKKPEEGNCSKCGGQHIKIKISLTKVGDPLVVGKQRHGPQSSIYHEKLQAIDRTYGTKTYDSAKGR